MIRRFLFHSRIYISLLTCILNLFIDKLSTIFFLGVVKDKIQTDHFPNNPQSHCCCSFCLAISQLPSLTPRNIFSSFFQFSSIFLQISTRLLCNQGELPSLPSLTHFQHSSKLIFFVDLFLGKNVILCCNFNEKLT